MLDCLCVQAKGTLEHSFGMRTRRQPGKSSLGASDFQSPRGDSWYEQQSEPASDVIKSKGSPGRLLHHLRLPEIWAQWSHWRQSLAWEDGTFGQEIEGHPHHWQFHGFWESQLFCFSERLPASLENTLQRDCFSWSSSSCCHFWK